MVKGQETISTTATVLAPGWDGTVTSYPNALAAMAHRFDRVVIVTMNDTVTVEMPP